MLKKRRSFTPEFKARVALEALSGAETLTKLAHKYDVYPSQVSAWKKRAKECIVVSFASPSDEIRRNMERVYRDRRIAEYELTPEEKEFLRQPFTKV